MKASIIVASYGDERWRRLGDTRAMPSAQNQGAVEVVRVHQPGGTVATSRNEGADRSRGDWLIFLDADDELSLGYVEAMEQADRIWQSSRVLFAPATAYRTAFTLLTLEVPVGYLSIYAK